MYMYSPSNAQSNYRILEHGTNIAAISCAVFFHPPGSQT